jgi:probable F420-dependent oxidoreductase
VPANAVATRCGRYARGEPVWTGARSRAQCLAVRSFRFGLVWDGTSAPMEVARRAEDAGYSALLFPDHTGMVAPLPAMAAAAAVTTRLRIGSQVINVAFRALGQLAQEAAAIDLISDGRLELGLGAGYAAEELTSLGLLFPPVRDRVAEVARTAEVVRRLFAGETVTEESGAGRLAGYRLDPLPPQGAAVPILVGGNGDRLLSVAAPHADIVQFTGFTAAPARGYRYFNPAGLADRVEFVRAATSGPASRDPELGLLVQQAEVVTDAAARAAELGVVRRGLLSVADVAASPFLLLGSVGHICDRLHRLRDEQGISYFAVFDDQSSGFDAVVSRLAGPLPDAADRGAGAV